MSSGGSVMPDTTELYYAHMEADRNEAEGAYFAARPWLETPSEHLAFKAGFERAYQKLWPAVIQRDQAIADHTGTGCGPTCKTCVAKGFT